MEWIILVSVFAIMIVIPFALWASRPINPIGYGPIPSAFESNIPPNLFVSPGMNEQFPHIPNIPYIEPVEPCVPIGPMIVRPYKDESDPCCDSKMFTHNIEVDAKPDDGYRFIDYTKLWHVKGHGDAYATEDEIKALIKVWGQLGNCPDEIVDSHYTVMFKVHSKVSRDSMYKTNGVEDPK